MVYTPGGIAKRSRMLATPVISLALLIVLSLGVVPAIAQEDTCIDDVTGRTNNCTASDVRLGTFYNIESITCNPGDPVTLYLRAEALAGAKERYDIGMFVATDGGDARTGACYQDYLQPPLAGSGDYDPGGPFPAPPGGPFYNAELDEDPDDACGDLEQGVHTYHDLAPDTGIVVPCIDTDGDGYLNVGACISWDSQKVNTCLDVDDAVPGTKAKCRCESLTVGNVFVSPGEIQVTKSASPDNVNEPGGEVTFTFTVQNRSEVGITLSGLYDSDFEDLTLFPGSTCTLPQFLAPYGQPDDSYDCSLTAYIGGPPGVYLDTVTATGVDENENPVSGTATEEVLVNEIPTIIEVSKIPEPPVVVEPGGLVLYTVRTSNNTDSPGPVKLIALIDDIYGDLMDPGNPLIIETTCEPVWIQPGESCECTFEAEVTGAGGQSVTDNVTAVAEATDTDSATVYVAPAPPPTGVDLSPPLLTGGLAIVGGVLLAAGALAWRRAGRRG